MQRKAVARKVLDEKLKDKNLSAKEIEALRSYRHQADNFIRCAGQHVSHGG